MTNEMRELIYSYEDSDHFDIIQMMNEIYDDECDPFSLDMMIAPCDDAPVAGDDTSSQ